VLEESQARLTEATGGEPYAGYSKHMQALAGALKDLQAEMAPTPTETTSAQSSASKTPAAPAPPDPRECGGVARLPRPLDGTTFPPDVRTPQSVIDAMLDLAQVTSQDVVYDLGCGDGRVLIAAAQKRQARGVGIDIDRTRVIEAQEAVQQAGVQDRVQIRQGEARTAVLGDATVVFLFLGKKYNLQLRQALRLYLKPGARVVSHGFDMGDWKPTQFLLAEDPHGHKHRLFLWKIETSIPDSPAAMSDEWDDWVDLTCQPGL
jgi:SAM-dependent methyltransferase